MTLTGDWLSHSVSTDYPYHLTATAALGYLLSEKTSLNLTYTYANYRYRLNSARGAVDINRVVMQVLHSF